MRIEPALALTLLARLLAAQSADTTQRAPRVVVSGVVRDSIARTTLAGAVVQLAARDSLSSDVRTTLSDSLGRFAFDGVSPGRYAIGFFHSMLDSLGLESGLREVYVDGRKPVHADLAIPSAPTVRAAICGPRVLSKSDAVVVGFVRDARSGAPAAGVQVTGEWLEIAIKRGGLENRRPHLVATTGDRGWFALCNVPSPGTILISARRGGDSTDVIEVDVPSSGLLRRELYLGPAHTVVEVDTLTNATRRVHGGDGHLSGVVLAASDHQPVPGALVSVSDGPQARTDARGEWSIADAPAGTRMIEIRALGYYPERRPVDVVDGAPQLHSALSRMRAVLDTVKVNASRLSGREQAEFDRRRRNGMGHYLTAEDVARRQANFTSELFRAMPGVRFDRANGGGVLGPPTIMVRGAVADWCQPSMYIDGHYVSELTADDLDAFVQPSEIIGIEVYTGANAPVEYQQARSGCGSIVIWTNIDSADRPKLTKARIFTGLSIVALSVLMGFLVVRH